MPGVARSEAPKRLLTLGRRPQILLEEVQEVKLYNNKGIDVGCRVWLEAKRQSVF